jgi:putative IMPACT (imprinted ancient) family translation regulator
MIINHLIPFEINISLLIDIVEKYRLEAEIEELVQTSFLGAETRYSENEALLNMKLKKNKKKT